MFNIIIYFEFKFKKNFGLNPNLSIRFKHTGWTNFIGHSEQAWEL